MEHALDAARKKADQVRARHGKAETKAAVLTRDIEALTERLAGLSLAGDRDEIESRLDKIKQAEETATRVRRALRAAGGL